MIFRFIITDTEAALKQYFSLYRDSYIERFVSYTIEDLSNELRASISELNNTSSLSILAAIEAVLSFNSGMIPNVKVILSLFLRENIELILLRYLEGAMH